MSPSKNSWLKQYFGKDEKTLNPKVVLDNGGSHAVVELTLNSKTESGSSRTGYILVKKSGKHSVTPHKSLHEGLLTSIALSKFRLDLQAADKVPG